MTKTLFLTSAERATFDALPSSLRDGWDIELETFSLYESEQQLKIRLSLADFSFYPEINSFVEAIVNGGVPNLDILGSLSPEVEKEIFFVLGAKGMKALIEALLREIVDDEDVELLASFSVIRHELLSINSSASND